MEPSRNINLIKTTAAEYPQLTVLTSFLVKGSIFSALILAISGLLVGGVYVYFQTRVQNLTREKQSLIATISADHVKEGLLVSVKDRATVIDKLSQDQKNIAQFFTTLSKIVPEDKLDSISLDDLNKSIVTVRVGSIAEASTIVDALMKVVAQNQARKPELVTFSLSKDGGYIMALSYIPAI